MSDSDFEELDEAGTGQRTVEGDAECQRGLTGGVQTQRVSAQAGQVSRCLQDIRAGGRQVHKSRIGVQIREPDEPIGTGQLKADARRCGAEQAELNLLIGVGRERPTIGAVTAFQKSSHLLIQDERVRVGSGLVSR